MVRSAFDEELYHLADNVPTCSADASNEGTLSFTGSEDEANASANTCTNPRYVFHSDSLLSANVANLPRSEAE
jgi:hypothetical protein